MYGIHLGSGRPATKKAVREQVASDPTAVTLERTSEFQTFDGRLDRAPAGEYHFVGPNPYNNRKFYGFFLVHEDGRIEVF